MKSVFSILLVGLCGLPINSSASAEERDRVLIARAETAEVPAKAAEPPPDPAPCNDAIVSGDDDRIITVCGALIGNDRALPPDRLKALIARGGAYARKEQVDPAIADDDAALRIDPVNAVVLNARGELLRRKGDRPRAIRDFGAAMKIDPAYEAARTNYKSLAQEIERLGAQMPLQSQPKVPLK